MDKNLVRAVIDLSIFLEFSSEGEIDEDAAMQAMEQLGYRLQTMNDSTRNEFIECVESVSLEYGERSEFVRAIPEMLGLR